MSLSQQQMGLAINPEVRTFTNYLSVHPVVDQSFPRLLEEPHCKRKLADARTRGHIEACCFDSPSYMLHCAFHSYWDINALIVGTYTVDVSNL